MCAELFITRSNYRRQRQRQRDNGRTSICTSFPPFPPPTPPPTHPHTHTHTHTHAHGICMHLFVHNSALCTLRKNVDLFWDGDWEWFCPGFLGQHCWAVKISSIIFLYCYPDVYSEIYLMFIWTHTHTHTHTHSHAHTLNSLCKYLFIYPYMSNMLFNVWDCWSTDQVINPAPGAWLIKFISLTQVLPCPV